MEISFFEAVPVEVQRTEESTKPPVEAGTGESFSEVLESVSVKETAEDKVSAADEKKVVVSGKPEIKVEKLPEEETAETAVSFMPVPYAPSMDLNRVSFEDAGADAGISFKDADVNVSGIEDFDVTENTLANAGASEVPDSLAYGSAEESGSLETGLELEIPAHEIVNTIPEKDGIDTDSEGGRESFYKDFAPSLYSNGNLHFSSFMPTRTETGGIEIGEAVDSDTAEKSLFTGTTGLNSVSNDMPGLKPGVSGEETLERNDLPSSSSKAHNIHTFIPELEGQGASNRLDNAAEASEISSVNSGADVDDFDAAQSASMNNVTDKTPAAPQLTVFENPIKPASNLQQTPAGITAAGENNARVPDADENNIDMSVAKDGLTGYAGRAEGSRKLDGSLEFNGGEQKTDTADPEISMAKGSEAPGYRNDFMGDEGGTGEFDMKKTEAALDARFGLTGAVNENKNPFEAVLEAKIAPVESGDLYEKLDQGVKMTIRDGGEVRLKLNPEHLGELNIKLNVAEGRVSADVLVDSADVKAMLDADSGRLKEIFSSNGLTLEKYTVEVNTGGTDLNDARHSGSGSWDNRGASEGRGGERLSFNNIESRVEPKAEPLYKRAYESRGGNGGVDVFI
ncbi:MAG: flagellar hook-length control protein FliK [Deltaproteobacteria bacterium]|nr:flagellar hook-length control protein FliK [Deltaproteobacteria bacterium]